MIYKNPFSGDVVQDIVTFWTLPWRWILSSSSQFGFIKINNMESSDRDIEEDIVKNVASYGKQLGRIIEILSITIERTDLSDLTPHQAKALEDFLEIAQKIADHKKRKGKYSPVPRAHSLEQLLIDIRFFKKHSPEALKEVIKELQDELASAS